MPLALFVLSDVDLCKNLKVQPLLYQNTGPYLSDMICTASCIYIHILSLCHLYSFTIYLKSHKCELPKGYFSCANSSQNLIKIPLLFITTVGYFIGH